MVASLLAHAGRATSLNMVHCDDARYLARDDDVIAVRGGSITAEEFLRADFPEKPGARQGSKS